MEKQKMVTEFGLKLCCIMCAAQATIGYAQTSDAECQQLYHEIRQAQQAKQHVRQLEKTSIAADIGCLVDKENNISSKEIGKKIHRRIMGRWSAEILGDVIPAGDKARFDGEQIGRLRQYQSDITAMQPYIGNTKENWLPALLNVVLDKPDTPQQFSQILQPIFEGYLNDSENGQLLNVVTDSDLGEFIRLLDQGLSLKNASEETFTSRAFGDPPQIAMMKSRSAVFTSSAEDDEPNSINTPIRFKFNSTELSERGKKEYQTMLKLLTSNTTKSIFLIGHSSPRGSNEVNCALSKRRVEALKNKLVNETDISASNITIAWAGENIPLNFGQADDFVRGVSDDHIFVDGSDDPDPMRRRVEIEINGELLRKRYAGQFCNE